MDKYISVIPTVWIQEPDIGELRRWVSLVQVILVIRFSSRNFEHDSGILSLFQGWLSLRPAIRAYCAHAAASNVVVNWSLQILIERLLLSLKRCVFLDLALCEVRRHCLGPVELLRGVSSQDHVVAAIARLGRLEEIRVLVACCLTLFGMHADAVLGSEVELALG